MLTPPRALLAGLAAVAVCGGSTTARGAEITDVASAFDDDNPFDVRLRVAYGHDERRAAIKREGPGSDDIVVFKDLLYARTRDQMSLRAEIGVFKDLALHVELPIIFRDQGEYRYDQSLGNGCVFPGMTGGSTVTCVNAENSFTVADGIVAKGGYDAPNSRPGMPTGFDAGSSMLFRGINRGGSGLAAFDTVNLGLTWGILSQRRDDTKPTWTLGFEAQVSFGTVAAFDRKQPPDANKGVSEGVHRFLFKTALSRRYRYVEPYMSFWYLLPVARGDSLYIDYGQTQKGKDPQMSGGTQFGLEIVPWEKKDRDLKLAFDLRGRIEGRFAGRGYSEAWELLAGAPALDCDPVQNPACDKAKVTNKYQGSPYSGLTAIENYATIGVDIGLVLQAGKYVRLHAGFQYSRDQSHLITADDVGKSFSDDACTVAAAGRVSKACEFNPAYRPLVNQLGRRYRVDGADLFRLGLWAQAMF